MSINTAVVLLSIFSCSLISVNVSRAESNHPRIRSATMRIRSTVTKFRANRAIKHELREMRRAAFKANPALKREWKDAYLRTEFTQNRLPEKVLSFGTGLVSLGGITYGLGLVSGNPKVALGMSAVGVAGSLLLTVPAFLDGRRSSRDAADGYIFTKMSGSHTTTLSDGAKEHMQSGIMRQRSQERNNFNPPEQYLYERQDFWKNVPDVISH